jgi:acyl-CoA synthetase (AMP-forming)/AMP-acid ligase II
MIFKSLFGWLANLFRSDRAKWIRRLLPYAVTVARRIASRDWDNDGEVESARNELGGLIGSFSPDLIVRLFDDYVGSEDVIGVLPVHVLKKVLAIAHLVSTLVKRDEAVPSYGILDTAAQLAYEQLEKGKGTV